jgi:hypothetical protein
VVVVARRDVEFAALAGIVNNKASAISNGDNNNRFSIGVNLQDQFVRRRSLTILRRWRRIVIGLVW